MHSLNVDALTDEQIAILTVLSDAPATAAEIAAKTDLAVRAVSTCLTWLRGAGVVNDGTRIIVEKYLDDTIYRTVAITPEKPIRWSLGPSGPDEMKYLNI